MLYACQVAPASGHLCHTGAGVVSILHGAMMPLLLCVTDRGRVSNLAVAVWAIRCLWV